MNSFIKKAFSLLLIGCFLVLGLGVVRVNVNAETETYQHIFTTKPSIGNNDLSGVSWNVAATNLNSYNSDYYAGVQIGSSKNAGSLTLTSSSLWSYQDKAKITEVRLWLNTGGSSVTPAVTIGGKAATSDGTTVVKNSSAGSDYTKATRVTFTPAANGDTGIVVINIETVKAGYICAIEIDCEEASPSNSIVASFSPNGGTFDQLFESSKESEENASSFTFNLPNSSAFSKTADYGYSSLVGWDTNNDGVKDYNPGQEVTITENTTFNAVFEGKELSFAEVIDLCAQTNTTPTTCNYSLKGYVSSIVNALNNNQMSLYITNGTDEVEAYKLSVPDNAPEVGDYIIVSGKIKKYYSTNEFDSGCTFETYIPEEYTVIFNSNGGSEVSSENVKIFKKVNKPTDPIKNGFVFSEWCLDEKLNNPFDFNTPITENITLYAKWEEEAAIVNVIGVSLDKSSLTFEVGDTETLIATVSPADATNKDVTWTSSNPSVATVDNGVITAKSVGNTTITVTTEDGSYTATCDVTVIPSSKGTIVFGKNDVQINSANVTGDDTLENEWTIVTEGTTSYTSNAAYYQVGKSSEPATSITFTTTLSENVLLDSLEIKLGGFNGTAGDVLIKIDDKSVGTGSLNATSDVTIKNSKVLTGKTITIEITNISKGVKVYYISYHYAKSYSYIQGSVGLDANSQGAFRLLGVSGSDAYDSYGVAYKNSTRTWHETTNLSVYDSVYAYDGEDKVSYTAAELGGSVIFGVEVTGLSKGVYTVSIKSFVEIDSVKHSSAERTFTITVDDSGVSIVEA